MSRTDGFAQRAVPCPYCLVLAGSPCVNASNQIRTKVHTKRLRAYHLEDDR